MRLRFLVCLLIGITACSVGTAQHKPLIQFNGVVVAADSAATPVAFASVFNRNLKTGSVANYQGFFSLVARSGDTIEISSVGYAKRYVVVPEVPPNQSYTAVVVMEPDVVTLPEARIYPWISKEQFRQAFVHMAIPDDALRTAQKNLNPDLLAALGKEVHDSDLRAKQMLQSYAATYYYLGQYQPMPILSPTAWMQFFQALRSGALFSK